MSGGAGDGFRPSFGFAESRLLVSDPPLTLMLKKTRCECVRRLLAHGKSETRNHRRSCQPRQTSRRERSGNYLGR